ncbi:MULTISPECIES: hypothetical protein [unclassified Brenneria]|uniref:hypothetical protein n=1 Tax=unclassified Brenneria TaxID=2634434 RepID=UPI0039B46C4D
MAAEAIAAAGCVDRAFNDLRAMLADDGKFPQRDASAVVIFAAIPGPDGVRIVTPRRRSGEPLYHAADKRLDRLPVFPDNQRTPDQCGNSRPYRRQQDAQRAANQGNPGTLADRVNPGIKKPTASLSVGFAFPGVIIFI